MKHMKQNYSTLKRLLLTSALSIPLMAVAGNIPQYAVSKDGAPYSEFTDGTPLTAMTFDGNAILFADNTMFTDSEMIGQGFPIGFDFRMGGRIFDCFALSNHGNIYLGRGDVHYGTSAFRLGMCTVAYGLYKADVSYSTEGEPGERILTVQYKDAVLNETGKNKGKYSLQIRLHESDGRIEMAFKEIDTCYLGLGGFVTGLRGWDDDDTLLLTATGLNRPVSVSHFKKGDMLEAESYIHWDQNDYDNFYTPVFVFTPSADTVPPASAPAGLTVSQKEDTLLISCLRGEDADATVVLISDEPFTGSDLPVDGETFRAGKGDGGEYFTRLGNAVALYYGNDEEISVSYSGVEPGREYHVRAISANGYPAFGREGCASQVFMTSHAGPGLLGVTSEAADALTLTCRASYPVIIASAAEYNPTPGAGYSGLFGTPSPDAQSGDEIPGGGTVIYAGDPGSFEVEALPNRLLLFRAWSVNGDKVSATFADAAGVPLPSFPYVPELENYPLNTSLLGWDATSGEFMPMERQYAADRALTATSIMDSEVRLVSPQFTSDRDLSLTFEFAMETEKDPAPGGDSGSQPMMQGYEPGLFGDTGYLRILSGNEILKEIREYDGTMVPAFGGGNEDGSSSFTGVEVDVRDSEEPQALAISFSTPKKSRLYIRNLSLEQKMDTGVGAIGIEEPSGEPVIHTVTGLRLHGRTVSSLPAGLYIINGRKVMITKK